MHNFVWKELPEDIAVPLLKGSVGQQQLFAVADAALSRLGQNPAKDALLTALAQGTMQAAWEGDLLNTACAHHALMLHEARPFLDPTLLAWGKIVRAATPPKDSSKFSQCILQRDMDGALRCLERTRDKEPNNIFLVRQGIIAAFMAENLDWAERWLKTSEALPAPVRTGALGDIFFARGQWVMAQQCYTAALRGLPSLLWKERLGEAALRAGNTELCLAKWQEVLTQRPWHTNLVLRRDDVAQGRHLPAGLPRGKGVILLYTFNKADCIDATLHSLMDSEIAQTPVLVLNNGSTDGTPQCVRAWEEKSGRRIRGIHLPCNVGAPAARNWLLTEAEVRAADWLVYLDDDVQLPADWLGYFGRAMECYPQHSIYGCRVVNHDTPMTLQSVDLHLDAGETREDLNGRDPVTEPVFARRFAVSMLHHQTPDFGDFNYMRPCASVTGCCHLFRRDAIDAVGGFDLRFSPSQYDDLEHDIRHILRGEWPVYQGHLRIRHMKQTGRSAMQNVAHMHAAWGNLFKLQVKYTPEQYEELRQKEHIILQADILRRLP